MGVSWLSGSIAAAAFLIVLWSFFLVRRMLLKRLGSTAGDDWRAAAADLLEKVRLLEVVLISLYLSTRHLQAEPHLDKLARYILIIVIVYRLTTLIETMMRLIVHRAIVSGAQDPYRQESARVLQLAIRVAIWIGAALFILSNLGFNISSMVAGLGVGGVAVALGAQAALGDLVAAIALYLDKALIVGDFIQVGDANGVVERIGLKTTRMRAVSGELMIFPNSQLAAARIQSFRRMNERRAVVNFSVPAQTPPDVLRRLPEQIRDLVSKVPAVRFERAHLVGLRGASADFEVVFFVRGPEFMLYRDRVQSVLFDLLDTLRADGVALA